MFVLTDDVFVLTDDELPTAWWLHPVGSSSRLLANPLPCQGSRELRLFALRGHEFVCVCVAYLIRANDVRRSIESPFRVGLGVRTCSCFGLLGPPRASIKSSDSFGQILIWDPSLTECSV